ncbi:uncharacterized protein LOC125178221 [Hyalella azteca]|uniref:Uncharacterized protein LOC125178221 n=1 Tax=Hyalella azteca TaxID=294128 RepID=A0A979FK92_HYAAZ|nr:uncharacterized protein LOC125178221 [Hyalella azteca]
MPARQPRQLRPTACSSPKRHSGLPRVNVAIEEIVIDSSDSSEDDEENSMHRASQAVRFRVVTPPTFDVGGSYSLRKYLEIFERYFHAKFHGGERECSMELGRFLQGEALNAYHAFGGCEKRYSVLKGKLLEWYRTREVHGSRRWKNKMKTMKFQTGETFKLFAMRVQEVAQKAYPGDDRECVKKMMEVYHRATPTWFNAKLKQKQDMKEMMGLGRRLNWGDILKLAEKEDKDIRDRKIKEEY